MARSALLVLTILSLVLVAGESGASYVVRDAGTAPATQVDISAPTLPYTGTVLAGNYLVEFLDGPTVYGFCVDPQFSSDQFQNYEVSQVAPNTGYAVAAWILNQYHSGAPESAAAQIAVWELVWDWNTGKNWTAGTFQLLGSPDTYYGSKTPEMIYNEAMYAYSNGGIGAALLGNYLLLTNDKSQDFLVHHAPLSPSVLLLSGGLLGLAAVRRRLTK
jgi:hypothetical protein